MSTEDRAQELCEKLDHLSYGLEVVSIRVEALKNRIVNERILRLKPELESLTGERLVEALKSLTEYIQSCLDYSKELEREEKRFRS